jgi:AbrB family looped-hinge helix DNA binding protein
MELAKVTSKGQLTIPKKIRDRLGLHRGDFVRLEVDGDRVVLTKAPSGDAAHLKALERTLGEWLTEADEKAYRDL